MRALPRVLSYPPRHDYVDRLDGVAATLVHRDQPWPRLPGLYDPAWLDSHRGEWDIAHLHFTWEQYPPRTLAAVLDAHRRHGTPIVWTTHDLRNPHTRDVSHDVDYLALLAQHADAITTLTPGAARQLSDRFGRQAQIIPHGPLVPPEQAASLRRPSVPHGGSRPLRLFLLAKSLRANLDWLTPMQVVSQLAEQGRPLELLVHLHGDASGRHDVLALHSPPAVQVELGPRLDDATLWKRVAEHDVLVLPYRWGTHSGLLELATDLGTAVVAGHVGFLSEQAPCQLVRVADMRLDPSHLRDVLVRLLTDAEWTEPVPIAMREQTLEEFRSAHRRLYERLSGRGTAVGR